MPKVPKRRFLTVCSTSQDSGQDNSEAHEDETGDVSEKMSHVCY